MKWGILSTAAINELVLAGARASDRVDVVAVASREFRRARRYALANDIERAHATYQALLSDPEVEAVYIPLPNARHVEWTRRALEAGKHVLVEKPFSRHAAEVAEVCELADRKGLVLAEAFMWRHHPQTARVLALVAEGAIGRLLVVRAAFSIPLEQLRGADDTRFDPALDGGSLMDVGCYCVSAIRLVSGAEPVRASAEHVLSVPAGALLTNKSPGLPCSKANNTNSTASSSDIRNRVMLGSVIVMLSLFLICFKNKGITEPLEAITFPYRVRQTVVSEVFLEAAIATFSIKALEIPIAFIG